MVEPLKKEIQDHLDQAAERAKAKELIIGIDPTSYLACEILKQSREIIALRYVIHRVAYDIEAIKKERQEPSRLKKILLTIINKIK